MKIFKMFLTGYVKKILPISILIIVLTALILFIIRLFSLYNLINVVSIEAVVLFFLSFITSSIFSRSKKNMVRKKHFHLHLQLLVPRL